MFCVGSVGGVVLSKSALMAPETTDRGIGLLAVVDVRVPAAGNPAVALVPGMSPEADVVASTDDSPDASPSPSVTDQYRELFRQYFEGEALYNQQLAWFYDDLLRLEAQGALEGLSGSFVNDDVNVNNDVNNDVNNGIIVDEGDSDGGDDDDDD
jgi:hypothetical protein